MEGRLEAALRDVISFLDEHGYKYALIGGIALAQWGVIRATYDADIKVQAPENDYWRARAEIRHTFPEQARPELPTNSLIVALSVRGMTVDLLLALPGYEELIIERASARDLGGWTANVCSAEDLIIQKAVAGRDKDWLDVRALLLEQHSSLDYGYIQFWLDQFADALESEEILARFSELRREAGE
jgi:predicted nucleotidyltransferase